MSTTPEPVDPNVLEQKRKQINRIVEEVARISESTVPPLEFYAEFLQRVLTALAAPAGAVWGRTAQGNLQLQYQINFRDIGLEQIPQARECHDELLRQVAQQGRARLFPPQSGVAEDGSAPGPANLTRYFIHLAPILIDKQVAGLIEVWQDPDRSPQAQRGFLQFIADMSEYAANYLKTNQLRQMVGQQQLWTQLEAYTRQIHNSLNPREVAYQVVNEGRRLIACDRVCVATRLGSSTQVEAISGADVIEKRSSLVQTMRALFDQVLIWGERLVYNGTKDDSLPPRVLETLDNYLAESNSKLLIIQPMKDEREGENTRTCRSAILVECFEPTGGIEQITSRMDVIAKHAGPALYNALEHRRLPFRWLLQPLANIKDNLRGKPLAIAGAVTAGLALIIILLVLIPYPLRMDAKGQLLPQERQIVYSRINGPITQVKVKNLDRVQKGQELATIQDLELQGKIDKLTVEALAASQRATLLKERIRDTSSKEELNTLKAQLIEQGFQYEKAKSERDILLEQARNPKAAPVPAPMDGTVVTFDPNETLLGRSVKPGDPLMQVANLTGPWEIVLEIPEANVGHIRDALARPENNGVLEVDVLLEDRPNQTYKGRLRRSGLGGEATPQQTETVLKARVEIDSIPPDELEGRLVGSGVRAKVRCGNRSAGYVFFYELWEFFYEKVLF